MHSLSDKADTAMKDGHAERLLKEAVANAQRRWGRGFDSLGPDLQQAVVRSHVLSLIGMIATVEDSGAGRLAALALQWPEIQA